MFKRKRLLLSRIFLVAAILWSFVESSLAARRSPTIELGPKTTRNIENVLREASSLHKALVAGEPGLVVSRSQSLRGALSRALSAEDKNVEAKKHLNLILSEARKSLDRFMTAGTQERKSLLQGVFQQIVLVGQTYRSSLPLKVYFCRKDRAVWIQMDGKPMNPINPEKWSTCASLVR